MRGFAERLHQLIRDAFAPDTLERTALFRLNERLDVIAPTRNDFDTVVFRLVLWADQHGRLLQLAEATAADRPQRPDLAELLKKMREAAAEAPRTTMASSESTPDGRGLPDYLAAFIRGYERLLRVMPENDQRTVLLEEMGKKIREFQLEPYDLPGRFHLSDSAGEHLAAIVGLRQRPCVDYLRWLSERLGVEYAFAGYLAAAALAEAARKLSNEELDDVADAVENALAWVAGVEGRSGRRDMLREAHSILVTRR